MSLGRRKKNQRGQAAIEFITVVVVVFFFLFFFMSLAFALVVSEYVEYATFMAARTYKSGLSTKEIQEQRARQVFTEYTQRLGTIANNFNLEFVDAEPERNQTAGVVTSFDINLFYIPPFFIKGTDEKPVSKITLTSEAHLGRDPSSIECFDFFTKFSQRLGLGIEGTALADLMDDNGC